MPSNKQYPAINYTSRDFNSIKKDLVQYAKRYYSDTYKDFSEAGFGALMLDTVSYVGDILSFYLDYNVNESFLDTAIDYNNILRLGKQMGFRFQGNPASYGQALFYIIVPVNSTATGPDTAYIPILRRGSTVSSANGTTFTLNEDVNFADPDNELVFAAVDSDTGNPTSVAIKASGRVISGELMSEIKVIGDFEKFLRVSLLAEDVTEIISVTDSEGNDYFEVDYLSQDVVYTSVLNRDSNKASTTATLRPVGVPRRFTTEKLASGVVLQFGFGSERDIKADAFVDPSKVVLDVHSKDYVSDVSFDPSNLLRSDKLGVAPANTTLTIVYRKNTTNDVNVAANGLINVDGPILDFDNVTQLNASTLSNVVGSLEVNNEEPILGDISLPTISELKERIYNVYAAQNRAVTALDYKSLCYSMPASFGTIKRVSVTKDPGSLKRNLNIYVLSEDANGNFTTANSTIKENLRQWLNQGRMINDTVDILDAKIINIGIEFSVVATLETNRFEVLNNATVALSNFYSNKLEIGEPFYIADIYTILNGVEGVVDTTKVKIVQKIGNDYSSNIRFDIDNNMSSDDRYVVVPDNAVLEIKFPDFDINGSVR